MRNEGSVGLQLNMETFEVVKVSQGGFSENNGVNVGDALIELNEQNVFSIPDQESFIKLLKDTRPLSLKFHRSPPEKAEDESSSDEEEETGAEEFTQEEWNAWIAQNEKNENY